MIGWVVTVVVVVGLLAALVWMFFAYSGTRGSSIEGRPRRRGRARRRAATGHVVGTWSRAERAEREAVVSFVELEAELRRLGAPAELRERARDAALDEVRHAEVCRALAVVHGEVAEPWPAREAEHRVAPRSPACRRLRLAQVAVESHVDGSVNEGREVLRLRALADRSGPVVAGLLRDIADDEAGHAALADDVVAWAVVDGGWPVRAALSAVRRGRNP